MSLPVAIVLAIAFVAIMAPLAIILWTGAIWFVKDVMKGN